MKKSIKKLNLSKSTISNLSNSDLTNVVGGGKSNSCINTLTCANGSCGQTSGSCPTNWCPIKW